MILVTGASGQLGDALQRVGLNEEVCFASRKECDITSEKSINDIFDKYSIDIVINCAAYTNVDLAEKQRTITEKINVDGVKNLSKISKIRNSQIIQISTDYVFDGSKKDAYQEEDVVSPLGVYGESKAAGERAILEEGVRGIIIRTSWLYSTNRKCFVQTILNKSKEVDELKIVMDQHGSPTFADDLAKCIKEIIPKLRSQEYSGEIFHFSNEGCTNWYEFAKEIKLLRRLDVDLVGIESKNYPTSAKRPLNSVLNLNKIKNEFDIIIPNWKESLKQCLMKNQF
ncbi:dTDP-4-dehydrorhamnose reductase [Bacteriovoracaceae bacterium]|nr:dTDP-4-dehydrorhamnose reductase [Bacteriovoracaceae bacterium]